MSATSTAPAQEARIRIAYVFDPVLPHQDTDAEQAINTISALVRIGADVELFLPRQYFQPPAAAEELRRFYKVRTGFPVTYLRSVFPGPRALEKLAHAVRAASHRRLRNFDVVYSRNFSAVLGALHFGHRVVYETYRPWPAQHTALAPVFRYAMDHPSFLGAVLHSQYALQKFKRTGISPEVLRVVHNGYEPTWFEPRLPPHEARAALGLPAQAPIALYAGRMTMGKGLGIVLEMARRMPEVTFALVGSQREGEVERQAASLPNVRMFPWTPYDELPQFFFAADVLILPPTLVGLNQVGDTVLPMKLFLYLAAGRPILAARAPDTQEILSHRNNAYLVPPDDVAAAIAGLRELIGDERLLRSLGRTAQTQAESLTWEVRARRIVEFIEHRLNAT